MITTASVTARIAALNDRCRFGLDPTARVVITNECLHVAASGEAGDLVLAQAHLMKAVRAYRFGPEDGAERDFGSFEHHGERMFFKIDYCDAALEFGSDDPADASATTRVLTIMLAGDY